jgi:hypothetical protein
LNVPEIPCILKPKLIANQIFVEPNSEVILLAQQLRDLILNPDLTDLIREVVIVADRRSLVRCQKAAGIVLIAGQDSPKLSPDTIVTVMPVGSPVDGVELEEFTDWLKNYIITQSVDEDEEPNVLFDGLNVLPLPEVSQSQVYDLYDTCLRFTMMSSCVNGDLNLDKTRYREALFVQYNIARLSAIIDKYEANYAEHLVEHLQTNASFELLTLDTEWKLVFRYLLNYPRVLDDLCERQATHRLVAFLCALTRDLSVYYSKTRVLIERQQPNSDQLVAARISLLIAVKWTLCDGLATLGLRPVLRM